MINDCIFCKIIKGEIPSYKIYENDYVYAFLDIAQDCEGHTLVIPKKHCVNSLDCDTEYYIKVQETVKKISEHYVNECGYTGVNIFNASGLDAQQSVFHYHVHIIPRYNNDDLKIEFTDHSKEINLDTVLNEIK